MMKKVFAALASIALVALMGTPAKALEPYAAPHWTFQKVGIQHIHNANGSVAGLVVRTNLIPPGPATDTLEAQSSCAAYGTTDTTSTIMLKNIWTEGKSLATPDSAFAYRIAVTFSAALAATDTVSMFVDYSYDGGVTWLNGPATNLPGADGAPPNNMYLQASSIAGASAQVIRDVWWSLRFAGAPSGSSTLNNPNRGYGANAMRFRFGLNCTMTLKIINSIVLTYQSTSANDDSAK